jgi:hypothetical protein
VSAPGSGSPAREHGGIVELQHGQKMQILVFQHFRKFRTFFRAEAGKAESKELILGRHITQILRARLVMPCGDARL